MLSTSATPLSPLGPGDRGPRDDATAPKADRRPEDAVATEDDGLAQAEGLVSGHANVEGRDGSDRDILSGDVPARLRAYSTRPCR